MGMLFFSFVRASGSFYPREREADALPMSSFYIRCSILYSLSYHRKGFYSHRMLTVSYQKSYLYYYRTLPINGKTNEVYAIVDLIGYAEA
jgi:hypothetical protein